MSKLEDGAARFQWTRLAEVIAAALIYFALARASLYFASLNASATPIWPPAGLAIALVLARGNFMLPGLFAAAFAANYFTTPNLATAAFIGAGNCLEAFVAAALLKSWSGGERAFYSTLGLCKFAAIVAGAAAPISATIGVLSLIATGYAPMSDAAPVWLTWWLGNLGGAILFAPALVLWGRTFAKSEPFDIKAAAFWAYAGATLVGVGVFSPLSPAPNGVRSALAFLAIMPLLWAALRLGLRDTATTALILSSFAIWGVSAGSSPFTQATLNESFLLLVAFVASATLPSLALAADRRESQAALDETRQELAQAQKLEALGQMTGSVAHDFNNLLAAIGGGVRMLNRQDEERRKTLDALISTLERGSGLTRQLLAFARREPLRPETILLDGAIESARRLIEQSIGDSIRVDVHLAPGLWHVRADRAQLELALLNLAVNARDAMAEGGMLSIRAENIVDGAQCVAISVADTGAGMSADVAARAFEPFFTTKPAGLGTGLGLAQVYGFAKQAGGEVALESTPGEGTIVTITLPRALS